MEITNELRMFKDAADAGYKIDVNGEEKSITINKLKVKEK